MARFLVLVLSLCLFSSAAAETCLAGDAKPTTGACSGLEVPIRTCDGAQQVELYGTALGFITDETCQSTMELLCDAMGAKPAAGADACGMNCVGLALCDKDADCPTNETADPRMPCCSTCEAALTKGCVGAEAAKVTEASLALSPHIGAITCHIPSPPAVAAPRSLFWYLTRCAAVWLSF